MLMRTDPFRELDRLAQQFAGATGTWSRPAPMPLDAYRAGDAYVFCFDLPGVQADAIEVEVERNTLTVRAERRPSPDAVDVKWEVSERPLGVFSRQIVLSDTVDADAITADYDAGVLTVRIPVAEKAKRRRIAVGDGTSRPQIAAA